VPGQRVLRRDGHVERGQAGPVTEQVAQGQAALPLGAELRPVVGHRRVEVQHAALDQQVCADGGHALGGRVDERQRVLGPRTPIPGVGHAAPQVDDLLSADVDGDRRPHVAVLVEVRGERLPHPLEASRHRTLHVHCIPLATPRRTAPRGPAHNLGERALVLQPPATHRDVAVRAVRF
jgi:hypothetical protein